MNFLVLNDNQDYDIDLNQMNYVIDSNDAFRPSEKESLINMSYFFNSKIELKCHNRALDTNNLFIEYEITVKGVTKPSGISVTKSDNYVFTIGYAHISLPTKFIKDLVHRKLNNTLEKQYDELVVIAKTDATDYIGTGILIPINVLFELYSKFHKAYRVKKVLKKAEKKKQIEEKQKKQNITIDDIFKGYY